MDPPIIYIKYSYLKVMNENKNDIKKKNKLTGRLIGWLIFTHFYFFFHFIYTSRSN